MILLGKLLQECLPFGMEQIEAALKSVLPDGKRHLLEANQKAITLGCAYGSDSENTISRTFVTARVLAARGVATSAHLFSESDP